MAPGSAQDSLASSTRSAGREVLSLALMDARNHTLALLAQLESKAQPESLAAGAAAVSPWWIAGHLGWFAEYWIGRNTLRHLGPACPFDAPRLASIEPQADPCWHPALSQPQDPRSAVAPASTALRSYMLETLESTLELLEKAGDGDDALHFYRLALLHEDLRGEQLIDRAQAWGVPLGLALPDGAQPRGPLVIPATRWMLGTAPGGFALDIERPAHEVAVPEFEIDAQPVTWAQFVEFVDDSGYDRAELWQPAGWAWLQALAQGEGRRGPRYVEQIGVASGAVMLTSFGRALRMSGSQPAMHMSWWEADAWCRWAGRRLPAEVEWELAAHSAARRGFRWGEVHEWTASMLRPWPGFRPDAWSHQSDWDAQPWFGRARVQRGGSFATPARSKHLKHRGFALPERDDGFAGFRSCAL